MFYKVLFVVSHIDPCVYTIILDPIALIFSYQFRFQTRFLFFDLVLVFMP